MMVGYGRIKVKYDRKFGFLRIIQKVKSISFDSFF